MNDFADRLDLASQRYGGYVVAASDDFFADKDNLVVPAPPVFDPHAYGPRGKIMDGWESRRKRVAGHDWAILRLGVPGRIYGVDVDTSFFRGNYPEHASLEACGARIDASVNELLADDVEWIPILDKRALKGDSHNLFAVDSPLCFTHVRLNIHPDGGVARLRVYGESMPDFTRLGHARGEIDWAYVEHGGDAIFASDMFFGERRNLIMPGRAKNMGDGWETQRKRGPGHDWVIVKLGAAIEIARVEVDTNHFIGNYPDRVSLEACAADLGDDGSFDPARQAWQPLLPETKMSASTRHYFEDELSDVGTATHVRMNVHPCGGVSRLRVYGAISDDERHRLGLRRLNAMTPKLAEEALTSCCASTRWVGTMLQSRPYPDILTLFQEADRAWQDTGPDDWHEAFAAHPRIGEKKDAVAAKRQSRSWSKKEQSGMALANEAQKQEMADLNRAYEDKFGFVFLICATGKSADAMVQAAHERLQGDKDSELRNAAEQQHEITKIRLRKLLEL